MISKSEAEKLGFRIEFKIDSTSRFEDYFQTSYDYGKTWSIEQSIYNDIAVIERHQLGRFYVYHIVKPQHSKNESLCTICANQGKVGIVQYAGIVEGTEKVCVEKWDGDYNYTEDANVFCRYAQWKCCSCGHVADSEYA